MLKRSISLLLALFLLLSPSAGMCSASQETVPRELFEQVLSDWEMSNSQLQMLYEEQSKDLTQASEELTTLKSIIDKQKEQLALLRNDLNSAKSETKRANESLEKANLELSNIVAGVKDIENKKRLAERQRNFWQVIAAALGIVCVVK